ncbi:MAG TPA: maleylpyruvate isomerase family mycothiol-dependent enzyme, partial [Acidimicrobiales bacterium]
MTLSVETYTNSIKEHSAALAAIAPAVLDEPVEHCPGWTVSHVLQHLIEVHWFWASIVEQRRDTRIEEGRPVNVERSKLVERFLMGADHLVQVLGDANQSDHVWTWTPLQNDVGFVTRHQVQEIMVHHWDV